RRIPPGIGARAETAAQSADDRAAVPRRRGGAAARLERDRQHLRQPALCRPGAPRRLAGHHQGNAARRHDRRPRSRDPPRHQLDAVAHQHPVDTAKRLQLDDYFVDDSTRIEDDHLPFVAAGVPSVDIIDLDYDAWHTAKDTLDACSARSLQVVADALLAALPHIEARLTKSVVLT